MNSQYHNKNPLYLVHQCDISKNEERDKGFPFYLLPSVFYLLMVPVPTFAAFHFYGAGSSLIIISL